MNPVPTRSQITTGTRVFIIEKHNQASGKLTEGIVLRILSPGHIHPRGIKVQLVDGKIGRVQSIVT